MACTSGPQTPFSSLKDGTTGSFWSPRVISSLWQDTAGTIPAIINSEVKRMDDLGGLNNHMLAPIGSRTINGYTYTFKGPTLRQDGTQYYLEFDGNGAGLRAVNASGSWPQVTGNNSIGITLSLAFETSSTQPALPSSGLGGTWMGSESIGNFGGVWWFGLRLSQEIMFYATARNVENTAWVTQWQEGDRYSNLSTSQWLDKKIIYTATGTVNNATFGGKEWIYDQNTADFSNIPFDNTSLLPLPYSNTFAIGARAPTNDNWIAGKFYGGIMLSKEINEINRKIMYNFLYISTFL
jgi:hypothetical protein